VVAASLEVAFAGIAWELDWDIQDDVVDVVVGTDDAR